MTSRLKDLLKTPEGDWFKGKLTRHGHFEALARIDDTLNRVPKDFTVEDRCRFITSCFGHFMSMHRELKFSGGVIHQLLLRELDRDGPTDEMRFLLGNQVVWFSKVEFSLITVLRFGVVLDTSLYVAVENDIHQGWTVNFNYQDWAKDSFPVFNYKAGNHNVFKVNKTGFNDCIVPPPNLGLASGNDKIPLKTQGNKWYICGVVGAKRHCADPGMKLAITVQAEAPAPAPTKSSAFQITSSASQLIVAAMVFIAMIVV